MTDEPNTAESLANLLIKMSEFSTQSTAAITGLKQLADVQHERITQLEQRVAKLEQNAMLKRLDF